MFGRDEILNTIDNQIEKLREEFTVSQIGVFGSAVRDQLRADSDIDILVDLREPTFDHYMDLKFYLEDIFQREVDLVMKDTVKPRLKSVINAEVIYAKGL